MQIIRWPENTQPQEHVLRAQMKQLGLSPYAWSNAPGDYYAAHTHSYEKVLYCVRGSIRFIIQSTQTTSTFDAQSSNSSNETYIDLNPGDCMILPAGVRHSAQVGPHGVTCLEAARPGSSYTRTA